MAYQADVQDSEKVIEPEVRGMTKTIAELAAENFEAGERLQVMRMMNVPHTYAPTDQ